MRRSSLFAGPIAPLLAFLPFVASQTSTAECVAGFEWMNNQKGQSPCLVAAWLISPCLPDPTAAIVRPLVTTLGAGIDYYQPPGLALAATPCTCSTVLYSLLAACGVCQTQSYALWSAWRALCTNVYVGSFPDAIPAAVSVPDWAYLDVTTANHFDAASAKTVAGKGLPDFSGAPSGVPGTSVPSPTLSSPPNTFSLPSNTFSLPTYTFTAPDGSPTFQPITVTHKKKTNVGAIVGGVIGGIAGLLSFIGGLWAWITRRNKQAAAGSGATPAAAPEPASTPDIEKPPAAAPTPPTSTSSPQQFVSEHPMTYLPSLPVTGRPYNPDDPSTFPDAMLNFAGVPSPNVSTGIPSVISSVVASTGAPSSPQSVSPPASNVTHAPASTYTPTTF